MPMLAAARLLLVVGAVACAAAPLAAEPVRLRSGAVYEARSIEVVGGSLRLGLELGAGHGRATFPFASVAPADLARILAMRTPAHDGPGQLTLARVALEAGRSDLVREAAQRAAAADPALALEAAALLAELETRPAREALEEIELDLRLGRPIAARTRARALLDLHVPVAPPTAEAAKARLLLSIAEALAEPKVGAQAAAAGAPPPPAPPAAPGAGPWAQALADGATLETRAAALRDQAGDAGLAPPAREALLLEAARDLLEARRVLLALPGDAAADLAARLVRLREGLGATWLDLADLARGAGRPDLALDRVQAALVLDPESPRAWELRRWVEGDLTRGLAMLDAPLGFSSSGWFSSGSWGGFGGHRHGYGPYAGGFRAHGHWHVGHGHGHGHGGGAVHNPGRRR